MHGNAEPNIPALNSVALDALRSLFNDEESLFSQCVKSTEDGLHLEKSSGKLSAIALLGLRRLAESSGAPPFDIASIQNAVWSDRSWVKSVEDLGLLTWLVAACCPDRLDQLFHEYDLSTALTTYSDARAARTSSLACLLAGIAHARLACADAPWYLSDVAVETYHLLENNQGECGIFGHAAVPRYHPRFIYNRLGTFADQVFAIYALATFARAFQIEEPLAPALSCANSLRDLQGAMGQWWFLYDKRACRVVNRYPVLSLNQYGLAPVGLLAIEQATGQVFRDAIYKGLSWTPGAIDLADDIENLDRRSIWDSVEPKRKRTRYWEATLSLMSIAHEPQLDDLVVRYETRPDHFGWLLYAFGSFGLSRSAHAVRSATTR